MERSVAADRVNRRSAPAKVEDDLAALWKEVAQESHAVRAIMSNLVVFRERQATDQVDLLGSPLGDRPIDDVPLTEVAQYHPCRLLVLVHARADQEYRTPVEAAVTILLFGSGESRHAVEQIAVRSNCADASLPSIVRRFTLGDLPTSVWWTDDLSQAPPPAALATIGRQFLYDSRQWKDVRAGFETIGTLLDHPHAPDIADLNWRRMRPLRLAVTHLLRPGSRLSDPVRIAHGAGDEAQALLLEGWMASISDSVAIERSRSADESLSVSTGGVVVALRPYESDAEAIAAELQSLGRDTDLIRAIRTTLARLTSRA